MNHLEFFRSAIHCVNRAWHVRERANNDLHPSVIKAYELIKPIDWQQLLLEWPHMSSDGRLAYTRDERKGIDDIQTVTTVGKYLTRHFDLPDHVIRNIASIQFGDVFKIVDDMPTMLAMLEKSPRSCMVNNWEFNDSHPYNCYDPKFGWSMAFRINDGKIMARALLNGQQFVRTFGRGKEDCGYSQADTALEAWLINEGFDHSSMWKDGTKIAHINANNYCGFIAPYLDGDNNKVIIGNGCLIIDNDGNYECNCQNGDAEVNSQYRCRCCDCRVNDDDDDMRSTEYGDVYCMSCYDDRYVYAYTRRGDQEDILRDNCIEVGGEWYDVEYLSDNDIVELSNDDYVKLDDAYCCDIDGNWYHVDDCCVYTEDDKTCHSDNTWTCCITGSIWSNDEPKASFNDGFAHQDAIDEQEENDIFEPVVVQPAEISLESTSC